MFFKVRRSANYDKQSYKHIIDSSIKRNGIIKVITINLKHTLIKISSYRHIRQK